LSKLDTHYNDYSDYIKGKDKVEDAELTKGWGQTATPLLLETSGGKQNVKGTRQIMIKKAPFPFFYRLEEHSRLEHERIRLHAVAVRIWN
jgi:hypothetical protein